jgi:HEAT repeat protein
MKYLAILGSLLVAAIETLPVVAQSRNPYSAMVAEQVSKLESKAPTMRAGAAEALGFLRAYEAEGALVDSLGDRSPSVRRQAAMALAWCGGRAAVAPLLLALDDDDWVTRQAAHVALTNLTGMELPFDALAARAERGLQAEVWRDWWQGVPPDAPPQEVLQLLLAPEQGPNVASATTNSLKTGPENGPAAANQATTAETASWRRERGLRALGALGGHGATDAILAALGPVSDLARRDRLPVRAGIRALGRLRAERGFTPLTDLLEDQMLARYAADALGDFGDHRALGPLLAAYPKYCKGLDGVDPAAVPADDKMAFPSQDRMLETPYSIAFALARLPWDDPRDRTALGRIAPLLMANLPGDHDAMMLYEPEAGQLITRYLVEQSGLRQQACEHAFGQLGQPRRVTESADPLRWSDFTPYRIASWLPTICTEREDVPRLLALLHHADGWVRLNAAKTLGWLGAKRAAAPIARILSQAQAEADYGFSGTFKNEEFNDPAPRWREGLVRALGLLGADDQTDLIVHILNDQRSVLEVRHAAADALAQLDNRKAISALREAARSHSFHSIRLNAADALRARGAAGPRPAAAPKQGPPRASSAGTGGNGQYDALLFIQGSNNIPNTIGTVEQADRWRQTYVVTDSGPVYRPGRNLFLLRPPKPDGIVEPLTSFQNGYVGEPELSWDARHVIFTHRGQDNPWWHLYQIDLDGSNLVQLTDGPYHDVGPAYLADGRIVFASSRSGIRDEYHGYPCTALYVMNADGTDMHPIATNIGRDNEPALLADGRIAFSRLEVFYSRNKTELTLHATRPDGSGDQVLYGPERRLFWRQLDHGPPSPADGQENPLTHRVLRMTQPQPMPDGRHIIVATQGGLTLVGTRRDAEEIITPDNARRAYTTPWPLDDGRVLCASTLKTSERTQVDLGLYMFDPRSKQLELVYNDPRFADFEARPIAARRPPPQLVPSAQRHAYSGQFVCSSVFTTQEPEVRTRGRLVRLIEGVPVTGRHSTHTNRAEVWKNHGGTFARVLGTAPLASDGSFFVETPADRLLHFQVLDSDRRVVGNQLTWISPRPGETRSCVGCHERPHTTTASGQPLATSQGAITMLPEGDEFNYRAKAWFKGHLPAEIEERTRTVRSVNLLGR